MTSPAPAPEIGRRPWSARLWSAGQFIVALGLTVGFLIYLLIKPAHKTETFEERPKTVEPVQLAGPGLLRIDASSPLFSKLRIVEVNPVQVTAPVLMVTGTVAASLRPGPGRVDSQALAATIGARAVNTKGNDYWQFNSPEVLTIFTDWQRATADISYARTQLTWIRLYADARLTAQHAVVDRLRKYVEAGTDAKKDLDVAQADLIQTQIQGQKDIHESETAVAKAARDEAAATRQLQQAGLDPALLTSITSDFDIVMADVPEGFLGRVKIGQACEASFFGVPDVRFTGRVRSIAPVVTKDRRSLRVLFTIDDLNDQLRPGMYAEIGLGTDARAALLAPSEGVIHVGRSDYLIVADNGDWRLSPVEIGESRDNRVEVLTGLKAGDRVIGPGAILLKPAVARSLQKAGGP